MIISFYNNSITLVNDFVKCLYIQNHGDIIMRKKLSRSGSGWALFMPKTLLELIDVNPETDELEVKVENDVVKITKASSFDTK